MSRMPGKTKLLASCLLAGLMTLTGCTVTTPYPVVKEPPSPVVNRPAVARKPVLALALGGGAARGFAHVGALQALDAAGIRPDIVVGTSAGSVVGAIYASGLRGDALRQAAEKVEQTSITDWQLPLLNRGVLRGVSLERFINEQVGNRNIQSMPMRLGIVATDLQSGEGILFRSGNTGQAVRASSAVPGVFEPVRIGTRDYVDGGLVAPVPVLYARQMGADVVVAIDISSKPGDAATTGQLQVLMQTFTIMGKTISKFELTQADVVLRPQLTGMSSADFSNRQKSIEAGRAAMQQALPQIRAALQPKR
ncbi:MULTISPECIES: patatin-like phospholipase family protein [Brachymonas]|uniref:patatin-like phospholipase family protein n=1 Tax=Brachymonas TaxID=28219 RepID=UPI0016B4E3CA|nr:patatin-like phospholipase family protein [Brachymonas sp. J145]MEE1654283.1 patatin-like phospholipase family protein [Brachymonas sp. J145]NLX16635.1 patatin-like phospholipase family protein [Ramlibacter sp.]